MSEKWLEHMLQWADRLGPNPWLQALGVVLAFLLLAQLAGWTIGAAAGRLLGRRVGADGAPAAGIGTRTVFRTIALVGLLVATEILPLQARLATVTLALVQSLLILVWIGAAIRGGRFLLESLSRRPAPPAWARPATVPLFINLLRVVLALTAVYAILVAWGVNVTGLVASAGILGLALSFAAQDTLANLFAGVAILMDQPYRIGDYIVLDSGERGQVTHIGLRSTRLLTRDDEEVSIPNGIMGRAKIVNESGGPYVKYRLRVPVSVAYGSDIDQVMAVLLGIAARHPQVCPEPEPRVRLRSFGESGIAFELLVWIAQPALRGLALHELNCEVYRRFGREGISIPVPQREVRIRDWPSPASR